jgi:hypothetical protein
MNSSGGDWRVVVNYLQEALSEAQKIDDKMLLYFVERALFHAEKESRHGTSDGSKAPRLRIDTHGRDRFFPPPIAPNDAGRKKTGVGRVGNQRVN